MESHLARVPQHMWLPYWLRLAGHELSPGHPEHVKRTLIGLGVNSRVWKLYAEYGDGLLRPLGNRWLNPARPADSLANCIDYLHILNGCEVDFAPPRQLVAGLSACIPQGQRLATVPVAIFREAWRAVVQAEYHTIGAGTFVEQVFIPTMHWYFKSNDATVVDGNRTRARWSVLEARWAEARKRMALPKERAEWAMPLQIVDFGSLRFIPLQSGDALKDEGEVMRHCVDDFRECCRKGCLYVYSLRDAATLDRLATVAVRGQSGSWFMVDLKADENRAPEERAVLAAAGFLRRLNAGARLPANLPDGCEGCLG